MKIVRPHCALNRQASVVARGAALLFLSCLPRAAAEQPWPRPVNLPKFRDAKMTSLPTSLRDAMTSCAGMYYEAGKFPDHLSVSRFDLNDDGKTEYLVENGLGGSGGPAYYVFAPRGKGYAVIANFQGGFYLARRVNGYRQIIAEGRNGGAQRTRQLYRYEHGRYHLVRLADYRVLEETEEWLRERDPKPFDTE